MSTCVTLCVTKHAIGSPPCYPRARLRTNVLIKCRQMGCYYVEVKEFIEVLPDLLV